MYAEFVPLQLKKNACTLPQRQNTSIPIPPEPIVTKRNDELGIFVTMIGNFQITRI